MVSVIDRILVLVVEVTESSVTEQLARSLQLTQTIDSGSGRFLRHSVLVNHHLQLPA